jgi:branched-subunit amino acid transport protein
MNLWATILIGSAIVAATKFVGFVLPARFTESPTVQHISDAVTVALLAALVVIQTVGAGAAIFVDARLAAVVVAGVLLWRKVPFILVIIAAAAVAALIRMLGWMA